MNATNDLEAVELSIEEAKNKIALYDALMKLQKNKSFNVLINEGYLENEAVRLVYLKSDYNMSSEKDQAYITRQIDSIGQLRSYFSMIFQQGQNALDALHTHEQTREEILAEELQGGE